MNPQDPLVNLHPLREPAFIGWWPLAPGWWILAGLVLLVIVAAWVLWLRHYRRNAYRRQALVQLQNIHRQYLADANNRSYLEQTNALLKAVALRIFPQHDVASCSGQEWANFLQGSVPPGCAVHPLDQDFATAAYRRQLPELPLDNIHAAACQWLKQHRVSR